MHCIDIDPVLGVVGFVCCIFTVAPEVPFKFNWNDLSAPTPPACVAVTVSPLLVDPAAPEIANV